jgi:hypothetical protein
VRSRARCPPLAVWCYRCCVSRHLHRKEQGWADAFPLCSALFRFVCATCWGDSVPESEEGQWLTYEEAGQVLGISAAAARMHAKRHGWPRRTPNMYGDRARVLVPAEAVVQSRSALYAARSGHVITRDQEGLNEPDQTNVQVIMQAIEALREQLGIANSRAERAERQFDLERERLEKLQGLFEQRDLALADARAAERIAATEAAGLRTELERRNDWGIIRRLRWVIWKT